MQLDVVDIPGSFRKFCNYVGCPQWIMLTALLALIIGVFVLNRDKPQKKDTKKGKQTPKWDNDGRNEDGEDDEENEPLDFLEEKTAEHIPLPNYQRFPEAEMLSRAQNFFRVMNKRRSVRSISNETFPMEIVEEIVRTAGTSPSGAHRQPWTFVVVSDPDLKQRMKEIVEAEELINYTRRMGVQWVSDLKPVGTDWQKPYLTEAPYIIMLFRQTHSFNEQGKKVMHYYTELSCSVAAGFLLAAIHHAGLVTVTTTPMNCGPQIRDLLGRPSYEKLQLLFPIGFPASEAKVPNFKRKPLEHIMAAY